jgi:23S rRNA (adenine-N6)-dimethyltransferase
MIYDHHDLPLRYSQNEIANTKLLDRLIGQSGITEGDLVYDIGAGTGAITEVLLNRGAHVVAIEKDPRRFLECRARFSDRDKFEIYLNDFLQWEFLRDQEFKVFANIPFFHTTAIVNRLLFGASQPEDCYLIVQKEAAEKFSGTHGDTLSSVLIKPRFWVDIVYYFDRSDFRPAPSVDVALLQFQKRRYQLAPARIYGLYKDFVVFCRESGNATTKQSLSRIFTYTQMKRMFDLLGIDQRSDPADLTFQQYLGLFQFFQERDVKHKEVISGADTRLRGRQAHLEKSHKTTTSGTTRRVQ